MKTHAVAAKNATPARNGGTFFQQQAAALPAFFATATGAVQTALTVSQPGDAHEVEAEKMADQVVAGREAAFFQPAAGVQRQAEEPVTGEPRELDRAAEENKEEVPETEDKTPSMQRSGETQAAPRVRISSGRQRAGISRRARRGSICQKVSRSAGPTRCGGRAARIDPSRARGPPRVTNDFENQLRGSKGGGRPLPGRTRVEMESAFGADFGGVRLHDGAGADRLSRGIEARAFTHGQDIYFARNRYQPENREGKHLLAHELTHVIQQGGEIREGVRRMPEMTRATPELQRVPTSMEEVRQDVNGLAEAIPGYTLATVVIGYNPILGQNVAWSAANFFRGAAGLIPGGTAVYDKLNEGGAIDAAFAWIEGQIAARNLTWGRVSSLWDLAWDRMGITEGISGNIEIFRGVFSGFFAEVMGFLGAVADRLMAILRDLAVAAVRALLGSDGPAYDMISMVIGHDPLTGEARPWETVVFLRTALNFFGFGSHVAKMDETGQLQNAADWLDQQFGILSSALSGLIGGIGAIWDSLGLATLTNPLDVLTRTVGVVTGFVGRLLEFVGNLAAKILELIKAVVISLAREYARRIPGYRLFTVIIGLDPITGEGVPRTAMNFVRGFLEFVPNGAEIYRNLEAGNAIGRAMDWLGEQAAQLGLTPRAIVARFTALWTSFSINDLMDPDGAFKRVAGVFLGFIGDVLTLAGRTALKLLEILFEVVMGGGGAQVLAILQEARGTFDTIVQDPVAFVGNLVSAAKLGFTQFATHILEHLRTGLMGWLFGALEGAGIQMPAAFDLRGILSLALQILGLTYAQIRPQLVEQLGEPLVSHLETALEIVRILLTEGIAGIWSRITEFLTVSLPEMVIGAIKNFVMERIVMAAVTRIASMLNPAGAVIQAIMAIYNTVMFFIERMNQIMATVGAFVHSVSKIAEGNIGDAANAVEETMARTLPVIISFLARLLGLGGISEKIREIVERIRTPIRAALGRVIGWIVAQARRLGNGLSAGREAETGPETPQSEEVKNEARTRLSNHIHGESTLAEITTIIAGILTDLRPRGLRNLGISEGENGQNYIFAEASPLDYLFEINFPGIVTNPEGSRETRTVNLGVRITQTAPSPNDTNDKRKIGDVVYLNDGPTIERMESVLYSTRALLGIERYATESERREAATARSAIYEPTVRPLSPGERSRVVQAISSTGASYFGGLLTPERTDENGNTITDVRSWNTGGGHGCGSNVSHAEKQFGSWYGSQPQGWRNRVIRLDMELRPFSPCQLCATTLNTLLAAENAERSPEHKIQTSLVWSEFYTNRNPRREDGPACKSAEGVAGQLSAWNASGPSSSPASANTATDEGGSTTPISATPAIITPVGNVTRRPRRKPKNNEVADEHERVANQHAETYTKGHAAGGKDHSLRGYGDCFGTDFSRVSIHNDARSARMCEGCQASAFTLGHDIYFNHGEYNPGSSKGQNLLAHELTHVVQQASGRASVPISEPEDSPSSIEGESSAASAAAGSRSHFQLESNTTMKIRPTFRRSARRVSRRAPDAPFFQVEAHEAPFFTPAADVQKKPAEKEPERLDKTAGKEPEEKIQAKRDDDKAGVAECAGCDA